MVRTLYLKEFMYVSIHGAMLPADTGPSTSTRAAHHLPSLVVGESSVLTPYDEGVGSGPARQAGIVHCRVGGVAARRNVEDGSASSSRVEERT